MKTKKRDSSPDEGKRKSKKRRYSSSSTSSSFSSSCSSTDTDSFLSSEDNKPQKTEQCKFKKRSSSSSSSSSFSSSSSEYVNRAKKMKHAPKETSSDTDSSELNKKKNLKKCHSNSSSSDSKNKRKHSRKIATVSRQNKSPPIPKDNTVKPKKCKRKEKDEKSSSPSMDIPLHLMDKKSMAPMSKEEWEKQQSVVKRVYDETTGRHRLIKGDGEILEEIVSRERHKAINQQATRGDGNYFQSKLSSHMRK